MTLGHTYITNYSSSQVQINSVQILCMGEIVWGMDELREIVWGKDELREI